MTQPPNNHNPFDPEHPGGGEQPRGGGSGNNNGNNQDDGQQGPQGPKYPQYPSYPSTPHPEDNAGGFGQSGYGGGPGYAGYGYDQQGPGYGQQGRPGFGGGPTQVVGNGKVDVLMAVRWAFRATFSNALVWILGTFLLFVVAVVGFTVLMFLTMDPMGGSTAGLSAATTVFTLIATVVTMVVAVFIYNGALRQADQTRIGFGDFFRNLNFWPTLAVTVIVGAAGWALNQLLLLLFSSPTVVTDPTAMTELSSEAMMQVSGMSMIATLLLLLLQPLHSYMVWYAADRREGILGAIINGFKDGARNYFQLLAFLIVSSIAMLLAAVVTLGLAMVVLMPAWILIQAHLYRQMAREPHPVA